MEFRVSELAETVGVGVDTIRFYQSRGLVPAPTRRGRFAIYDDRHLEAILRIRSLIDEGFSLAQIHKLLDADGASTAAESGGPGEPVEDEARDRPLLEALASRSLGSGTLSRTELAGESRVPEPLIGAAVQAGLLVPVEVGGEERFPRSDLELLRAGLEILEAGIPLDRLLELATEHAAGIDQLVERAIDLFDEAVRQPGAADEAGVRRAFERLLPRATEIVALHFQRTVVARALDRLRARGDERAIQQALEATRGARLEVQWR